MTRLKLPPALTLVATLCLSGCVAARFEPPPAVVVTACPAWPVAGPEVAAELEAHLPADKAPATWGWLGRLATLRDQLQVCR